jgi:hypothetical protein
LSDRSGASFGIKKFGLNPVLPKIWRQNRYNNPTASHSTTIKPLDVALALNPFTG